MSEQNKASGKISVTEGKGYGFIVDGKFYLKRCFECGLENYAPAVSGGQCAWCGDKPEVSDE